MISWPLVIAVITGCYCLLLVILLAGWRGRKKHVSQRETVNLFYSVIVPVRDEEHNIAALIQSIAGQVFPPERFEVILVNDHSTDGSAAMIRDLINRSTIRMSLLELTATAGKKAALKYAIEAAKGDIMVTTDADCSMSRQWLRSVSYYFENANASMVFGPVTFKNEDTFFKKLQSIEFASLIGVGAASLTLGMPNMCNGANLAFRKTDFLTVGGYSDNMDIASGDDEFLMHKFYQRFPQQVYFNRQPGAVVITEPHGQWSAFFQQRKRWASKWRHYKSVKPSLLAIFIFLFNLSFIAAVALLLMNFRIYGWLLFPVLVKIGLEGVFLSAVLKFLRKKLNPGLFIFLQFTYPFYVVLFGIAANFGKYTWKGRKH